MLMIDVGGIASVHCARIVERRGSEPPLLYPIARLLSGLPMLQEFVPGEYDE